MCYNIDPKYRVPKEEISCPGCGQRYGHHNTRVCTHCQECSKCCNERGDTQCSVSPKVAADVYIQHTLGYQPY